MSADVCLSFVALLSKEVWKLLESPSKMDESTVGVFRNKVYFAPTIDGNASSTSAT